MRKTNRGRNIILVAVTSILCGSAALTAYASNVRGETGIFVKQETEQEKPVLPVDEEKMMFEGSIHQPQRHLAELASTRTQRMTGQGIMQWMPSMMQELITG